MMAPTAARAGGRSGPWRWTTLLWLVGIFAAAAFAAYGGWVVGERREPATAEQAAPGPGIDPAAFGHRRTEQVRFSLEPTAPPVTPPLLSGETRGVYAFFQLPEDVDIADVQAAWWWNAEKVGPVNLGVLTRDEEVGVTIRAALVAPSGAVLGAGVGEFEATHAGVRIARGSFVTAEEATDILAQPEPPARETAVRNLVTALGVDDDGRAHAPAAEFDGDDRIWVVFEYQGADAGAAFVVRWYCEGHELPPARKEIVVPGERGRAHAWLGAGPGGQLPPAEYEVRVSYGAEGKVLGQGRFRVRDAAGAAPSPAAQP